MRGRRLGGIILLVALGLLAIAALRDFARLGNALPWNELYDFADFYCAGAALDRGADPYRYEPLHRCEHAVNQSEAYRRDPARAVPAPLPAYDFPPFMLAAQGNFSTGRAFDAIAITVALLAVIWGLTLVAIPFDVALLAFALPGGYVLLAAGQVVPFALLALVFCGVALALRRDAAAGVLAAFTLIEPHLGLPVCAGLLVWRPRSRFAMIAAAFVLGCIAIVVSGFAAMAEYIGRVVPAQAAAEIGYVYQYSLSYLLHTFGMPAPAALAFGDLSYVAILIFGVWLGSRMAETLGRPELFAYLPAACSVVAGPYVHMVDLPFAIPAALVLATSLQGRARQLAVVALALLAVPWISVWITKKLFAAALFVVAVILLRLKPGAAVSVGVLFAIAATIYLFELFPPAALTAVTAKAFADGALAQEAWSDYVARLGHGDPAWFLIKLPTWTALCGMLAACLVALRTSRTGMVA